MSDTFDAPTAAVAAVAPPEILTYGMTGGIMAASINQQLSNPPPDNMSTYMRHRTVMAWDEPTLESRCISVLISEYGLSQAAAQALIPSAMQPMVAAGAYVPLDGSKE